MKAKKNQQSAILSILSVPLRRWKLKEIIRLEIPETKTDKTSLPVVVIRPWQSVSTHCRMMKQKDEEPPTNNCYYGNKKMHQCTYLE